MPLRITASIAIVALSAAIACGGDDAPGSQTPVRPDSSSGEVAQFALMKNQIGWLTDSNVVALATQVNRDAQEIARLEAQAWSEEPFRLYATEILRDHARMQFSIDSVATLRRIPSQNPAVAPEIKAPYDSLLNTQVGLPLNEREAQFLDMMIKVHARSALDFGALAGNTTDPDLRTLLATRAVLMEQAHASRAQLILAAVARADSAAKDSAKARRGARP
jgi:hypothetical protein